MNVKLISNNIKELIEEVFLSRKKSRGITRSARYFSNISDIELHALLHEENIGLVLDVGANSGQFYSHLRDRIGYKGHVCSFEPNPEMHPELQRLKKNDQNWELFTFALGASESKLAFNIYKDSKLSSFLNGNDTNSERFKGKFTESKSIEVPVKTLDSFLEGRKDLNDESSIFLKLDTQGFDLEVLKGLQKHKTSVKYIQSELSVIALYDNMPHYTASINFFEEAGYKIVSLIPVTRERKKGFVIEFDALWGLQN